MRILRPFASLALIAVYSVPVFAQQSVPSGPAGTTPPQNGPQTLGRKGPMVETPPPLAKANDQGAALLQKCLAAVGAQASLADITLTGTITILMPSGTSNTGPITMAARGDSQAQITMQTATGTHTEVRSVSSDGVPAQMRTDPGGIVTHSPVHGLFTPHPAWFFPQFVLTAQQQSTATSAFIGSETRAGVPVNHLQVWQSASTFASGKPAGLMHHETQYDLYLDPTTSLPVAAVYWVQPVYPNDPEAKFFHTDNRVPVEIQFSGYQVVQGIPVAHQIKAFLQGRQIYSIQISSATINGGVVIPSVN